MTMTTKFRFISFAAVKRKDFHHIHIHKKSLIMNWLKFYEDSTEPYNEAKKKWPTNKAASPPGKWILASYDDESIIVYQAFNEKIADFACKNGFFIGCPDYNEQRMTCKKMDFLTFHVHQDV